jgi:hypothetical protein
MRAATTYREQPLHSRSIDIAGEQLIMLLSHQQIHHELCAGFGVALHMPWVVVRPGRTHWHEYQMSSDSALARCTAMSNIERILCVQDRKLVFIGCASLHLVGCGG